MPSIPKTNTLNLLKIQCICLYDQHNAEYSQCVCSVSAVALLFSQQSLGQTASARAF